MLIKILGPGCVTCAALERATRAALAELGLDATVEHVTDYAAIAGYGVMSTPALVIDDQVVLAGRVPPAGQLAALLTAGVGPTSTRAAGAVDAGEPGRGGGDE